MPTGLLRILFWTLLTSSHFWLMFFSFEADSADWCNKPNRQAAWSSSTFCSSGGCRGVTPLSVDRGPGWLGELWFSIHCFFMYGTAAHLPLCSYHFLFFDLTGQGNWTSRSKYRSTKGIPGRQRLRIYRMATLQNSWRCLSEYAPEAACNHVTCLRDFVLCTSAGTGWVTLQGLHRWCSWWVPFWLMNYSNIYIYDGIICMYHIYIYR